MVGRILILSSSLSPIQCYGFPSLLFVPLLYIMYYIGREYPEVVHSLDIWHKAKKLRKALAEVTA